MKKIFLLILIPLFLGSCKLSRQASVGNSSTLQLSESQTRQLKYFFYEGLRLREEQKYDQALESFRMCLSIDSMDVGSLSEVSLIYSAIGLPEEAMRLMMRASDLSPDNWWINARLISNYSDQKMYNAAIAHAQKLQRKFPYKEDLYHILVGLYKQTGQFEAAINTYDYLESFVGINEQYIAEKYRLYSHINKPKKATAEFDKLLNKYPNESRYKVIRGDIYLEQKQPEKAFEMYSQVLEEDPHSPFVYVSLSEYYNFVGLPEKALDAIVSALKNEKLDVETKIEILGQYVEKLVEDEDKLSETESLFKLLVDDYPLEEQVHGYYAMFLLYKDRNEDAIAALETMLNINPKNDKTWFQLIQLHMTLKNYDELLDVTERAISAMPAFPQWYFYRGITQYQLQKFDDALVTNKAGLEFITPDQTMLKSDFYAQIADLHFKLEQKDSAFAAYELSLLAFPANIHVLNNYAYYLSLEKSDLRKAERMSAKTIEKDPKNSTYLDTYAWILYQQGNYSLAKFYIERAIENLDPEYEPGVIYDHYGDILWMTNNDEKALEMWKRAMDSGYESQELLRKIENKGWDRSTPND